MHCAAKTYSIPPAGTASFHCLRIYVEYLKDCSVGLTRILVVAAEIQRKEMNKFDA